MTDMAMQGRVRTPAWRSPSTAWLLTCAAILVVFLIKSVSPLIESRNDLSGLLQDDGYYYIIPATNIAHGLGSTFDGLSRTNGYHPLWLLILAGLSALGVPGIGAAIGAGLVLNAIGLALALWLFRRQPPWFLLLAAGAYFYSTYAMSTSSGMETDVLAVTFLALLAAIQASSAKPVPIWLGVCAALCIMARLDDALFVVPLVAAGAVTWRERIVAGTIVFVTSCVYVACNLVLFGLPLPVSGEVKSLGGLQINHLLLRDIASRLAPAGGLAHTLAHWVGEPFLIYAIMVAVAIALFFAMRGRSRYLLAAFIIGLTISVSRELFLSSWRLWPWYYYPLFIGSMTILFVLAEERQWREPGRKDWANLAMILPLAAVFLVQGYVGTASRAWRALRSDGYGYPGATFYRINERAAAIMNQLAPGARVAMGDRSGSFAYYYSGHVVQLEGLMNDAAYYRMLKQGGDAKALLCRRGVQYVIAYSDQSGDYTTLDVPVVRPQLSDYPRYPVLRVSRQDQVMKFADPALYTGATNGDHDDTIYAWKLSLCPESSAPAK